MYDIDSLIPNHQLFATDDNFLFCLEGFTYLCSNLLKNFGAW